MLLPLHAIAAGVAILSLVSKPFYFHMGRLIGLRFFTGVDLNLFICVDFLEIFLSAPIHTGPVQHPPSPLSHPFNHSPLPLRFPNYILSILAP